MSDGRNYPRWKRDATIASGAGVTAAVLMGLAAFGVGRVSGGEARILVEAILPTSRFLCSAVMTACATILALMLTLLSMSINSESEFSEVFFHRVKQIAFYDMVVLFVAVCFLLIHCVPITKSDAIPSWWYSTAYYSVLVVSAMLSGAVIAIVTMLYAAICDIIHACGLDEDRGLRNTE